MAFLRTPKSSQEIALDASRKALRVSGVKNPENDPRHVLYGVILAHKEQTESDATARAELYRRFDNLYFPQTITQGGADHWPNHPTAKLDGKVHISVNTPPPYVDSPADIQAIPPIINAIPDSADKKDQEAADRREKLFWGFWGENNFDMKFSAISHVRSLYGAVATHPYWDPDAKLPRVSIVEAPENLRIGWGANDFSRKDWALYCYSLTPQAIREDFGLDVSVEEVGGTQTMPVVYALGSRTDTGLNVLSTRGRSVYEQTQVSVYDYWYKKVTPGKVGERAKVEIRNAVYVGNYQIRDEAHPEHDVIPYVYIPNGFIPGQPDGRSELHDLEHIFHEQDEALSRFGQIMAKATDGQMWQLNGENAPDDKVPAAAIPKANTISLPGGGNVINPITPYLPAFQAKEYLDILDNKLGEMSGVSKLLLGLAVDRMAGSSKAMRALVQMYVPRIALKRQLLYQGLLELWDVTAKMWERKDPDVKAILAGNHRLDIQPPEITPRDDQEQMNRAVTAVQNSVWSLRRAMDATGVDNPSEELALVMAEKTNAALNPAAVTQQIQLIGMARQLNIAPQAAAQQGAQPTIRDQALADLNTRRTAAAQRAQTTPPGGGQSANTPAVGAPGSMPSNALAPNGATLTSQTMSQNGKLSGRILSSQEIPVGGNG